MHWIDPDSLPEVTGTIERFVLNPHGEVDGFVMTSEGATVLVHTPPHMEADLTRHARIGDKVGVRGVKPRGADLFAAVAVTARNGRRIVDDGPDHDREHPKREHRCGDAAGTVQLSLFGPKGELRGALLTDGTVVRIGPKEAEGIADLLAPGASLAVRGDAVETPHGRVVHGKEAGKDLAALRPLKHGKPGPKGKHGPKHKHEHKPRHEHEGRA
jgi:hypothetical protein